MEDKNWNVAPGGQLSLDLAEVEQLAPTSALEVFASEKEAAELLHQLARAIGESRATMDIEEFRKGLVLADATATAGS